MNRTRKRAQSERIGAAWLIVFLLAGAISALLFIAN